MATAPTTARERMHAYALLGVRASIEDLLDRVVQIKTDFPDLSSLATVQAALLATVEEADELAGNDAGTASAKEPERAIAVDRSKPRPKPKPKSKSNMSGVATAVRLMSWEKGRDVLNLLAKAPNGLKPEEIGASLGLERGTAYYRLKVRERKGHVRFLDQATATFEITPAGKAALAKDQDNEDVRR